MASVTLPLIVVACRLVWAPFRIYSEMHREIEFLKGKAEGKNISPNTLSDALIIEYMDEEPYSSVSVSDNGSRKRTISIQIRNEGDGFLTQCSAAIQSISPPRSSWKVRVISSQSALAQGEYKIAQFMFFYERQSADLGFPDAVMLTKVYGGGWGEGSEYFLAFDPDELPLIVTIEASARECRPREVHFRITVDQFSSRLRMEPA